jgi:hypothetical protein
VTATTPVRPPSRPRSGEGSRRRRPRHLGRWIALGVAVVVVLVLVGAAVALVAARGALVDARGQASAGQAALLDGDLASAQERFADARASFGDAEQQLGAPWALGLRAPFAASNRVAVIRLAQAGALVAGTGERVAGAELGTDLLSVLSPRDGVIPVVAMRDLAPLADELGRDIAAAHALAAGIDTTWLAEPVVDARAELLAQIGGILPAARNAGTLADALPAFLGADGPRTYFVGAASPSELRGSAGLIGAYALMEADDGRMSFGDFLPVQGIGNLDPGQVAPPDPSLATRYDRYGGTGFWLNINMTPDFPSAATQIERLFAATAGEEVDGTIVATPVALAAMMAVTGDVDVPGFGTIRADEAVEVIGNDAYGDDVDNVERKRILGAAAKEILSRFLGGAGDPVASARVLTGVVASGDLLLHSADPQEQAAFTAAGIAGSLDDGGATDMLAVAGNNAAGSKVDFYAERTVRYDAVLAPGGEVRATSSVRLRNDAPTVGPAYVIGPFPTTGFAAGENATILSTYCGRDCRLRSFSRDGAREPMTTEFELGHPVYTSWVRLLSGAETELSYAWDNAAAWSGDAEAGSYRFAFLDQATIRPTELEVTVTLPDGVEVTSTSPGVVVGEGIVTWSGEPSSRQIVEVEWRRPPLALLRSRVAGFFNQPVLGAR